MPRKRSRKDPTGASWGSLHPLLDLHGLTGDDARVRADAWLRARRGDGVRTVLLVTGRGNRSAGPPVLRGEVEDLLHGLSGELVESFSPLPGGGGFQVELARPEPPRPLTLAQERAARRVRSTAPELRRRAEETLWELGIAPTPALLAAEIQRIQEEEESS
ncbi:MAG TPA: Smr/MutS family protein [Longimicrobium sp.]